MQIQTLSEGPFGVNCYLVSHQNQAVLIDPGVPDETVRRHLAAQSLTLCAILLTHGHVDHIAFADAWPEVPLYIHRADLPALTDPVKNVSTLFGFSLTISHAARLLNGGETLELGGMTFFVHHTPGHSPGSVCYQAETALFCGDTLFCAGRGRTDLPGGAEETLMASIASVLDACAQARLYPGHGPQTTAQAERARNLF